jgi:hypothetical protein
MPEVAEWSVCDTKTSATLWCRLLNPDMQLLKIREDDLRNPHAHPGDPHGISSTASNNGTAYHDSPAPPPVSAGLASRLWLFGRSYSMGDDGLGSSAAVAATSSSSSSNEAPARALRQMRATAVARGGGGNVQGVGLVIDGGALAVALQPEFENLFLDLCKACSAVVCCRVSPMQKAQVGGGKGAVCSGQKCRGLWGTVGTGRWGVGVHDEGTTEYCLGKPLQQIGQ